MYHPKLTRRVLPAFIVINILILFIYSYALLFVLPQHPYIHPIAILLFLLSELSLYQTLSPIPLQFYQATIASQPHVHELCKKCSQPRPPRTHHCSKCDRCIPRMNHHCGVLSTCIGGHNFKAFLLLLFYAFLSGLLSLAFSLPEALHLMTRVYAREMPLTVFHVLRAQALYAQFGLTIAMLGLLVYHCYYIWIGWTIVEVHTVSPRPRLFPPWRRSRSKFDKGWWTNLGEVFGTGYKVMLPTVDIERISFKQNEAIPDVYVADIVR